MTDSGPKTGFFAVLRRELRRAASRPIYLLVTLVLPLLSFGLLGAMMWEGVPHKLPIAVCNLDESMLSHKLVRMLDASASMRVAHRVTTPEEGHRLMNCGEAYGLIVLPRDMQRDLYRGLTPHVLLYYNNQYLACGGIVSRDAVTVISTFSAGINLNSRLKRGESSVAAMNHMIPIRVDTHVLFNPYVNYAYYLITTLLPSMLQLFILVATTFAIGIELKEGTAGEWLHCAGGSVIRAVAGKLLPYSAIFILVGLFMNVVLFDIMKTPMNGSRLWVDLATVLYVFSYQSMSLTFVALMANFRMALSLSAIYASPAFAFTGVTFPAIAMPLPAKIWSNILPITHFLKFYLEQSLHGSPLLYSMPALGRLAIFAALGPVFLPRMKQIMSHERYWGRV
jgi:ABC-2 type transport system permease protein